MKGFFGFVFRAILFVGALALIAWVVKKLAAPQAGPGMPPTPAGLLPIPIHNVPNEIDGFFRLARRRRSE